MTKYAERTSVAPEKSRAEIERTLSRYGASAFGYGWQDEGEHRAARAVVTFVADNRHVKFGLPLPRRDSDEIQFSHRTGGRYQWRQRTEIQQEEAYQQAVRQRWRALALCIKAKLEAVAAGIVTFEEEFLAHMVLPSGETVAEWFAPQLESAYETGQMPASLILALPAGDDNVIDLPAVDA
jgi:hypothetical protein